LTFVVWGQNPNLTDEVKMKKDINEIKLTGDAIYADLYQDAIEDEFDIEKAKIRSKEMLMTHVIEIFSKRLKMSKEDVREIWEVLDRHSENIVVKKGDLFRVFTYVMKNSFGLGKSKKQSDAPVIMAESKKNTPNNEVKEQVIINSSLKSETNQVQVSSLKSDSVSVLTSKEEVKLESVSDPVVLATPKVEPKVEPKLEPKPESKSVEVLTPEPVVKVEPVVEVVVPDLCQTMISKGNMTELMRYLNQEKKYQRLMYGNRNSMQFLDKCYIVIIDKGNQGIITVLDKGTSERMNFVSKQMDSLANYRGGNYAAIYVQEY
jgi:hypothetical protein